MTGNVYQKCKLLRQIIQTQQMVINLSLSNYLSVSRASPRKRSITPKRAKMSCPNKACPATSAEKAVTVETRPAMTTKRPIIVTSDDLT